MSYRLSGRCYDKAYLDWCWCCCCVLKLVVGYGDCLHGLIALQHQFPDLLQHLAFDAQQLAVPLVGLADASLVRGLSFHCLLDGAKQTAQTQTG